MKRMALAWLMMLCVLTLLLPAAAMAATGMGEENAWDVSATSADSVKAWVEKNADGTTYTLYISGKGNMADFAVNETPWILNVQDAKTVITAVEIGGEVTRLGDYSLAKLAGLTTINGNNTAQTKTIVFPAQLTSWGHALNGSGLSGKITFPKNCQLDNFDKSLNIFGNNHITAVDWTNYPLDMLPSIWTEYGEAHTALLDLGLDTIPANVKKVGAHAFKNSYVTSIVIPNTADVSYDIGTFVSGQLEKATIYVDRKGSALPQEMFRANANLRSVAFIGNELAQIPGGLFYNAGIQYIAVPYGVSQIESNTKAATSHYGTFGVGPSSALKDEVLAVAFPSTLTEIIRHNNQDELFSNRSADKLMILSPASFDWGTLTGGLGQEIDTLDGFYQYTLGTSAVGGEKAEVFFVTDASGAAVALPAAFGTLSYESSNPAVLDNSLNTVGGGTATISIFLSKSGQKTKIAETTVAVSTIEVRVSMMDANVPYDGKPHTIEAIGGGLPGDLKLVYHYKPASSGDSAYTTAAPSAPGVYTVRVSSGTARYSLLGTTTATLTIQAPDVPKTGDHTPIALLGALLMLSGLGMLLMRRRGAKA